MSGDLDVALSSRLADGWSPTPLRALIGERGLAIVFWSAVCSHCRRYDDYLNGWANRFPIGLAVIGCRVGEAEEDLDSAAKHRGLDFPLLHDVTGAVARGWGARQTPTVFLLDEDARVTYRGAIDDFTYPDAPGHRPYLDDAATAQLEGRPAPIPSTAAFGCPTESPYYGAASLFTDGDR